jgi:hypothetical protein
VENILIVVVLTGLGVFGIATPAQAQIFHGHYGRHGYPAGYGVPNGYYNPTINIYPYAAPPADPYGGYFSGAANLINAQGAYLINGQQADAQPGQGQGHAQVLTGLDQAIQQLTGLLKDQVGRLGLRRLHRRQALHARSRPGGRGLEAARRGQVCRRRLCGARAHGERAGELHGPERPVVFAGDFGTGEPTPPSTAIRSATTAPAYGP